MSLFTMLFEAQNITVDYGKTRALENVNLHIRENEILILMGPNGAGKSTVLKSMFGLVPITHGTFHLHGNKIHPTPRKMIQHKIVYVSQEHRVFPNMTVEENLRMGVFIESDKALIEERISEVLKFFPLLKKKFSSYAFHMSGGEQQILSLGRALMQEPHILMLDEPSLGLAPKIISDLFDKIQHIHETFGTSLVIVEHNLKTLMNIAHRGYILAEGKVLLEGSIADLNKSDILEKVFFW